MTFSFHRQPQALHQPGTFALRFPAVHLGKFRLQFRSADAVFVAEIGLGIQGVFFLHDVIQGLVAHDDGIQHRVGIIGKVVLFQHGHALIFANADFAMGGLQFAG